MCHEIMRGAMHRKLCVERLGSVRSIYRPSGEPEHTCGGSKVFVIHKASGPPSSRQFPNEEGIRFVYNLTSATVRMRTYFSRTHTRLFAVECAVSVRGAGGVCALG